MTRPDHLNDGMDTTQVARAAISRTYEARFTKSGLDRRKRVWKILCSSFFQRFIPPDATILELACGYGEFINNIRARQKIAIDLNPDSSGHLDSDILFKQTAATDLSFIASDSIDRVFTSNFLEHLKD